MQSIFSAIRTGAAQLVIVLLLGVVFIYVFSIVTFNTYVVSIYEEEYPASSCESVIQCILTLYTSGVINDSMDEF
jgi:sensor histidine kinase YesM